MVPNARRRFIQVEMLGLFCPNQSKQATEKAESSAAGALLPHFVGVAITPEDET